MTSIRALAHQKGFVETLWNRRIYFPEIVAAKLPRQKAAERAAINAPLQDCVQKLLNLR